MTTLPHTTEPVAAPDAAEQIRRALAAARETRRLDIAPGAVNLTPAAFVDQFGRDATAAVVADVNTFTAAGRRVGDALGRDGIKRLEPFVFTDADLYAEHRFVERLEAWMKDHRAIPIAVGSGTINDLVKLAAHRTGRQYLAVATAASMDGYTAFGASITYQGSKQTFDCPAPRAVVADLDVIATAPPQLGAAGFADLAAKVTAGADWILADALGIEPIDATAWELVQVPLPQALADPAGVREGHLGAVSQLVQGLMMGGFAMQWTKTSRPASGAEHQFSHLWDMQHHVDASGHAPSHGFKVAIGTLAVSHLYELLLREPLDQLDVDRAVAAWLGADAIEADIRELLGEGELADKARDEMKAKAISRSDLSQRLTRLRTAWPSLRERLRQHLPGPARTTEMLAAVGAPTTPEQIGIDRPRLRRSFRQAHLIRRRFTVLDLAAQAGVLDRLVDRLFSREGPWTV